VKLIVVQLVKQFLALYGKPKVHYCVRKSQQIISVLSQINPVNTLNPLFFKINLNTHIILLLRLVLPSDLFPSDIPSLRNITKKYLNCCFSYSNVFLVL
jgi:hypothetical protein